MLRENDGVEGVSCNAVDFCWSRQSCLCVVGNGHVIFDWFRARSTHVYCFGVAKRFDFEMFGTCGLAILPQSGALFSGLAQQRCELKMSYASEAFKRPSHPTFSKVSSDLSRNGHGVVDESVYFCAAPISSKNQIYLFESSIDQEAAIFLCILYFFRVCFHDQASLSLIRRKRFAGYQDEDSW